MKKIIIFVALLTLTFGGAGISQAGEFENGFKNELGAIGARTAVGIIFDGLFQQGAVNTDNYLDPGYRARIVPRQQQQTYYQQQQAYPQTTTVQYIPVQQPVQTQTVSSSISSAGISFGSSTQFNISQIINQLQSSPSATVSWTELQKILARSIE